METIARTVWLDLLQGLFFCNAYHWAWLIPLVVVVVLLLRKRSATVAADRINAVHWVGNSWKMIGVWGIVTSVVLYLVLLLIAILPASPNSKDRLFTKSYHDFIAAKCQKYAKNNPTTVDNPVVPSNNQWKDDKEGTAPKEKSTIVSWQDSFRYGYNKILKTQLKAGNPHQKALYYRFGEFLWKNNVYPWMHSLGWLVIYILLMTFLFIVPGAMFASKKIRFNIN